MNARNWVRAGCVVSAILGGALTVATLTTAQAADESAGAKGAYKIDSVHSSVIFKIKHMNVANFYGRVNEASGSFDVREGGSIDVKINMSSLASGNAKRDQHLAGPDFFSVKEFPEAGFKSTSIKKTGAHTYEATGDMTLHGVTKPVTAKIEHTGEGKGRGGKPVAGIEARATIKRADFGMSYGGPMLGADVELIVALEGAQ